MPEIGSEVWLPIATLLLGYVGSLITEWFRDSRAGRRESRARREEREERLSFARRTFQRETLLRLQEVAQAYGRLGADFYAASMRAGNYGLEWQRARFEGEYEDRAVTLGTEVMMLKSRVADDEIRALVDQIPIHVQEVMWADNQYEARRCIGSMALFLKQFDERIGALLRGPLY